MIYDTKKVKDSPGQRFIEPVKVCVERIDDIFSGNNIIIPLVKLDIQGYECKALSGMQNLLKSARIVTTEVDKIMEKSFGCSQQAIAEQSAEYDIQFDRQGTGEKTPGYEVVARKRNVPL